MIIPIDADSPDPDEVICGGNVTILIDANPLAQINVFKEIEKALTERQPRNSGTVVQRCRGTEAQRRSGGLVEMAKRLRVRKRQSGKDFCIM